MAPSETTTYTVVHDPGWRHRHTPYAIRRCQDIDGQRTTVLVARCPTERMAVLIVSMVGHFAADHAGDAYQVTLNLPDPEATP